MIDLKIIPRISEKTYALSMQRKYVFDVPLKANRQQIASAVAAQYNVEVEDVNVLLSKGKTKRSYRKGGKPVVGKRNDIKKAFVTLAEGNSIKMFDEPKAEKTESKEKK